MFKHMQQVLITRIEEKWASFPSAAREIKSFEELLEKFELPLHLRALSKDEGTDFTRNDYGKEYGKETGRENGKENGKSPEVNWDLGKLTDGLPFPAMASGLLGGATYAAHTVLYEKRAFLDSFARRLGKHRHPRRALWITDTWFDKNGVSRVLQSCAAEALRRNLPVDFLVCASEEEIRQAPPEALPPNLIILPPLSSFKLPFYPDQSLRIPDLLEVQKAFQNGGYDRLICSTEAPMGALALYLKHAFNVPAYFYLHTDWLDFAKRSLSVDPHQQDRLRRLLRTFYGAFDGVFLLNREQRERFASPDFGLAESSLKLTAHWASPEFRPRSRNRAKHLLGVSDNVPVLLFAGRLSKEKGVEELPKILARVRQKSPQALLVFAGTGPMEDELRRMIPDGLFLGWQPPESLAGIYSACDLLVLPSWFDTFSCVLLEALSCGLPAASYDSKGPRDLLAGGQCGRLADSPSGLAEAVSEFLATPSLWPAAREAALRRASEYAPEPIFDRLLKDIGLPQKEPRSEGRGKVDSEIPIPQKLMAEMRI
jgi:glycosyltransferase involved in cell wall biosynthesis